MSSPPPRHVRTALGHDATSLHVSWTSALPVANCSSRIHYGADADHLAVSVVPICRTYTIEDMCESPANTLSAWSDPGTQHDAVLDLTALNSEDALYYQIDGSNVVRRVALLGQQGYDASGAWTGSYPYSFIGFGDLGLTDRTTSRAAFTMKRISAQVNESHAKARPIRHILLIGDVAYASGRQSRWAQFMGQIEPIASSTPWMVGAGNHDVLCTGRNLSLCPFNPPWPLYLKSGGSGGDCGVPYDNLFFMPGPGGAGARNNRWYSFDHGPVHTVVLSSEDDMRDGSPQHAFFAADLAATRARTPGAWVVVGFHRPVWGSSVIEFAPERAPIRAALQPLFLQYQVDVCLSGHVHQYQRSKCRLGATGSCDPAGVVYLTVGSAGPTNTNTFLPTGTWVQSKENGIVRFDVVNHTHMRGSFLQGESGTILDEFYVTRPVAYASLNATATNGTDVADGATDSLQGDLRTLDAIAEATLLGMLFLACLLACALVTYFSSKKRRPAPLLTERPTMQREPKAALSETPEKAVAQI
jgi:3',5'-cyclic AMP phosphodiesterase CpdA